MPNEPNRNDSALKLEAIVLAFVMGVPLAYWMLRTLLAFVGL